MFLIFTITYTIFINFGYEKSWNDIPNLNYIFISSVVYVVTILFIVSIVDHSNVTRNNGHRASSFIEEGYTSPSRTVLRTDDEEDGKLM